MRFYSSVMFSEIHCSRLSSLHLRIRIKLASLANIFLPCKIFARFPETIIYDKRQASGGPLGETNRYFALLQISHIGNFNDFPCHPFYFVAWRTICPPAHPSLLPTGDFTKPVPLSYVCSVHSGIDR